MKIELRAWHKELNIMLYPPNIFDSMIDCRDSNGNHVRIELEDPFTKKIEKHSLGAHLTWDGRWYVAGRFQDVEWMLNTGEVDLHGKKIFEGDIVNGCSFNGSYAYGYITYYKGQFLVYPIGKFLEGVSEITDTHLEVIGNIYENTDYLK